MKILKIQQMLLKELGKAKDKNIIQTKWKVCEREFDFCLTDKNILFFIPKDCFFLDSSKVVELFKDDLEKPIEAVDLDRAEDFEFINRIEIIGNNINACVLSPVLENGKYKLNIMIDKKYFDLFDSPEFFGTTPDSPVAVKEDDVLRAIVMPVVY